MFLVYFALRRPYSVAAGIILICLLGVFAISRMATDIFPEINIPVVAVVWQYSGMSPEEMQNRIIAIHERQMAQLVDDVEHMEANSYNGVGVIKVFLHEGANIPKAVTQLSSSAQYVLKYMPRNVVPPLVAIRPFPAAERPPEKHITAPRWKRATICHRYDSVVSIVNDSSLPIDSTVQMAAVAVSSGHAHIYPGFQPFLSGSVRTCG